MPIRLLKGLSELLELGKKTFCCFPGCDKAMIDVFDGQPWVSLPMGDDDLLESRSKSGKLFKISS